MQVPASCSRRIVQPTIGQLCTQPVTGSQLSPASTTPLPHVAVQSRSLAAVQPGGQHSSPLTQVVCSSAFTQAAAQVPAFVSVRRWHFICGQLVGQVPGGSQVSPGSIRWLPHPPQSVSVLALHAAGQQRSATTPLHARVAHAWGDGRVRGRSIGCVGPHDVDAGVPSGTLPIVAAQEGSQHNQAERTKARSIHTGALRRAAGKLPRSPDRP